MPTYAYINTRTNQTEERCRPVALRDDVPKYLKRITVPDRIAVRMWGKNDKRPEIDVVADVARGFKHEEEKHGAGHVERVLGMTSKQIKRVWNNFNPNDQKPSLAAGVSH